MYYLPEKYRELFVEEFEEQKAELESLGRGIYLSKSVEKGLMSEYFAKAITSLEPIAEKVKNGQYEQVVDDLIAQRPDIEIPSDEVIGIISLYDVLIAHIQNAIDNEDQASIRTPCSLGDFFGDVVDGAMTGLNVGTIVGAAIAELFPEDGPLRIFIEGLTLSLPVWGAIIGGVVGAIGSLFSNGNCDCGPATSILVRRLNDTGDLCDPSYRLEAMGAGDDAEVFNWIVNEGNSSAIYNAQPARLSVPPTQESPEVPLFVTVTTLCPDEFDEGELAANTFSQPINLFDAYALVEEVGDILVFGQFEQQSDGTIEFPVTGTAPIIRVSSTNGGTLRNTFTITDIVGAGGSTTTGVDEFRIFAPSTIGATGSFRILGTNDCSGSISDLTINFIMVQ